jgi:hypothetical protein
MLIFMRKARLWIAALLLLLDSSMALRAATQPHATDLQGRAVTQLASGKARVVILIFAATDCPISKRYIPEIARLQKEFSSRGVAFWWVFPNPGDTASVVRAHELDYSIHSQTLIDASQELVRMSHARVTPEAAVFAVDGAGLREVYHGRIDDRYLSFGKARPQATRHELESAINATLAGTAPSVTYAPPVGCSIVPLSMQP